MSSFLVRWSVLGAAAAVALAAGIYFAYDARTAKPESEPLAAAALSGLALPDVDGKEQRLDQWRGKLVVVNFWATWCKPCLKELPDLSRVYERYKDRGLIVLGVLASDNPDNGTLLNFQSDNEMTFPVVRATSDILTSYDYPGSLPTTFIFDRTGHQAKMQVGALSSERLTAIIDPLLSAN